MQEQNMHPASLMMSYGYRPDWSEGAIKCPIFQTSTFVFRTAEEGKAYFELAYGLRPPAAGEKPGLIYSRLNHPDLEILENRLCLWDRSEACTVFNSGMAAITTALTAYAKPGDLILHSEPLYGGTIHYLSHVLSRFGVDIMGFRPEETTEDIAARLHASGKADRLAIIYIETPANPTNDLFDLAVCRQLADRFSSASRQVLVMVDNTYMGPLWQHPLSQGADLVLYSATKYIGGHSDLIAGACLGSEALMKPIRELRTFLGNLADAWTGWLLLRSLETMALRMEKQASNAGIVAAWLASRQGVQHVHYLGLLSPADGRAYEIYQRQCTGPGAMLSLEIPGGEAAAFAFLNRLKLVKLAVSLGSTESLAQHPATMTHAGMDPADKARLGISPSLVRLSIGVEHPDDIIADLDQALG